MSYTKISLAGTLLAFATLLGACAGPGCSTPTDPLTCSNTEGVNNYNRQRQLGLAPPGPQYPDQYQRQDAYGRGDPYYYRNYP